MVPRDSGDDNERNAWIILPCFHGDSITTVFVVLDASNLAKGPVCQIQLDHHIPWALHGTWWQP